MYKKTKLKRAGVMAFSVILILRVFAMVALAIIEIDNNEGVSDIIASKDNNGFGFIGLFVAVAYAEDDGSDSESSDAGSTDAGDAGSTDAGSSEPGDTGSGTNGNTGDAIHGGLGDLLSRQDNNLLPAKGVEEGDDDLNDMSMANTEIEEGRVPMSLFGALSAVLD